ncbi:hypothetical protein FKV24_009640, partial [Lysobacter maris]
DATITAATVDAGTYTLSETNLAGYTAGAWTCDAGTLSGDQLTLANGETATCTITNDDQAATLTLEKVVDNTGGGTAVDTDWTLSAAGPTAISGVEGDAAITAAAVDAGTYTLSEAGAPADYLAATTWVCSGATVNGGNQVTLGSGETAICSITNTFQADPALTVTKAATFTTDTGTAGEADLDDVISYTVTVANSGNVTVTNIAVGDVYEGGASTAVTCPQTMLAPGASMTCTAYTHTVTQVEVDAGGTLDNTATATGEDPTGAQVSDDDTESVPVAAADPALTIAKAADTATYAAVGDVITYTYTITNAGNVTLAGPFTVNDDILGALTDCATGPLAPGASTTCTA